MKEKLLLIFILFQVQSCSYLPSNMNLEPEQYQLTETSDYLLLEPIENAIKEGILFIPGGLVDPHAYIESFLPFTRELKMKVVIVKVRSNLAIINSGQAAKVRSEFQETRWLLGGHSLGGVVACMNIKKEGTQYEGLFLLGSYANNDISDWDQPVFSFMAENDNFSTLADIEANANLLPSGINVESLEMLDLGDSHGKTIYYLVKGGNHAQFGNYGEQKGDGTASISGAAQQEEFFQALKILMINNGFEL
jgi:pimeloyl-ACP methyl ester carboxylesterase